LLAPPPAVADPAVRARAAPDHGEVPVAVVVPRPGAGPDPEALVAWVAERVAPHKRVRAVRLADALPRTPLAHPPAPRPPRPPPRAIGCPGPPATGPARPSDPGGTEARRRTGGPRLVRVERQ